MKLSEFLQGKWLGHPLHAALVHVPVGAWVIACGIDIALRAGWIAGPVPLRLAHYAVAFGLLGALIAVPPGLADWLQIKPDKPAKKLGVYHLLLNAVSAILWAVNFTLRLASPDALTTPILLTSLAGTALLFAGAYLGSLMVYDHGIGVARFSKKELRQRAVRAGSRVPEES
jgi:Predicted membrane protein